ITAARVASSSLDKITAEYLEQQLILAHPERAVQSPAQTPAPSQPAKHEPIVVVSAPPPVEVEALQKEEPMMGTATAVLEAEPPPAPETEGVPVEPPPPPSVATAVAEPEPEEEPIAKAPPAPPPPPPVPAGPKVGDKVGFIQLPTKPAPKVEEKFAPKPPPRP